MISDKILPRIILKSQIEVFKRVVEFNRNALPNDGQPSVIVRVALTSGFSMEGSPLRIDDRGHALLVTSRGSLGYLNIHDIAGIEIINPELMIEALTDDSYVAIDQDNVPTTLQLKRHMSALREALIREYSIEIQAEVLSKDKHISDVEKSQLHELLTTLSETVDQIAADGMGKEALQAVKTIHIQPSEKPLAVERQSTGVLRILVDLSKDIKTQGVARLKNMIESQL